MGRNTLALTGKIITQSEKAEFAGLEDTELRDLMHFYQARRDYLRASYISRLLVRRQRAQ